MNIIPNLDHPEQILPLMTQKHLSTFLYVLFAGALVSAILSTVDSALLAASAMVSHNIIVSARPTMEEKKKVLLGRSGVVVLGIISYVLALHAEGVYNLVKDASSFASAGVFVVVVFGLFTKFGGVKSAIATIFTGATVWFIFHYLFSFELSYILALVSALASYVVVGFAEKQSTALDAP